MKVVITGANGFIGQNLVHLLSETKQCTVEALVKNQPHSLLAEVNYHSVNLTDFNPDKLSIEAPDTIVHLAQSNRYREFPEGAEDMFSVNVQSTFKLLEWARKQKIKKFIFASTGSVYQTSSAPLTENSTTASSTFYPSSKLIAEQLLHSYRDYFDVIILRLFSVYGKGQQGMLVPNIIHKILAQEEIILAENIGITLSPLYVSDAVKALRGTITKSLDAGIYNCGGSETINLREIITCIENYTMRKAILKKSNNKAPYVVADSSKLMQALNWQPGVNIQEGIKNTLSGYII